MGFNVEVRQSDAPYVDSVMHGWSEGAGEIIRPAEIHWHMVLTRYKGLTKFLTVGPWTSAGDIRFTEGVEILWIKFKLGAFMPHFTPRDFLNAEVSQPDASGKSFYLKGAAWQFPTYENADTFIDKLAHQEVLTFDPLIYDVLNGYRPDVSSRTVRHRFLQSTGMSQGHIFQHQRAQRAVSLLQQGMPIADAAFEAGYYDQPHLTRSLKKFVGYTPTEIALIPQPE